MTKLLALSVLSVLGACTDSTDSIYRATTTNTGAEIDIEVRYAGGVTADEAAALLDTITLAPAREEFPGVDLSQIPSSEAQDEPLDASEPTFAVVLHPMNDAAASERYAWHARPALRRDVAESHDGIGEIQQGLSVGAGITIDKYIPPGDSWTTARYQCYAPFGFAADFTGVSSACADMGRNSVAGSRCSLGYDPSSPVVVVHDGVPNDITDWSPFTQHYFRGRVTPVTLFGRGTGSLLHAWGVVCL